MIQQAIKKCTHTHTRTQSTWRNLHKIKSVPRDSGFLCFGGFEQLPLFEILTSLLGLLLSTSPVRPVRPVCNITDPRDDCVWTRMTRDPRCGRHRWRCYDRKETYATRSHIIIMRQRSSWGEIDDFRFTGFSQLAHLHIMSRISTHARWKWRRPEMMEHCRRKKASVMVFYRVAATQHSIIRGIHRLVHCIQEFCLPDYLQHHRQKLLVNCI